MNPDDLNKLPAPEPSKGEPIGAENVYLCPAGHHVVTRNRSEGTTSMTVPCQHPGCRETMKSTFYDLATREKHPEEPTHEWFRPANLRKYSRQVRLHILRGGLLLRPVVKLENLPAAGTPHVGRNELCPCGSGKKFKKCCWHLHHIDGFKSQVGDQPGIDAEDIRRVRLALDKRGQKHSQRMAHAIVTGLIGGML